MQKHYIPIHFSNKFFTLLISLILFSYVIEIKAQVVNIKSAFVSIEAGTIVSMDSINNDISSTVSNEGSMNFYSLNNGGNIKGNGFYYVKGDFINSGIFTANSSTVNFIGSIVQTISGLSNIMFNNLTISNTNQDVKVGSNISVSRNLSISNPSSVLDLSSFAMSGGASFSNLGSGQIRTSNTSSSPLPEEKTWTCKVAYNNVTGGQTIVGGTYNGSPSLQCNNTSGTQTASGNIVVGARFNIISGGNPIINLNGYNLSGAGSILGLNMSSTGAILDMKGGSLSFLSIESMSGKIRFSGLSNGFAISTGTIEYAGSTQNIAPGLYNNLEISSLGTKTVSGNVDVIGSLKLTSGIVVMGLNTLKIKGDISHSAGLIDITSGKLEMNGTNAQTIDGVYFKGKSIFSLVINNVQGVDLSSVGDTVRILNSLEFANSTSKMNTNGKLTLVSTSLRTASIGSLAPGNLINGNVTVERYISSTRKWRFLAVPTYGQTFKQSWQEGAALPGANPKPGYGFLIGFPHNLSYVSLGFDMLSVSPTVKVYDVASSSWKGISRTDSSMATQAAYMSFVLGDRSGTSGTSTVARTTGSVYQGTQPVINIPVNSFVAIGNPFPSSVKLTSITKNNVQDAFYVWDPNLAGGAYGLGAYQTISRDGDNYTITPGGGSYGNSGSIVNNIESGQSFFVRGGASSGGSLFFKESDKGIGSSQVFFTESAAQRLRVNLVVIQTDSSTLMADGIMLKYDSVYSNELNDEDILKIFNGNENLSIESGAKNLVVENRNRINDDDTIHLMLSGIRQQSYQLQLSPDNLDSPGLTAYFIDRYLQSSIVLNLSRTNKINFKIDNIAGSYAPDRFKIVFRRQTIIPLKLRIVSAFRDRGNLIEVKWNLSNEVDVEKYFIERSFDGVNFLPISDKTPQNNSGGIASYVFNDTTTSLYGAYFYRIKAVLLGGETEYSNEVKVQPSISNNSFIVCPNPVIGKRVNIILNGILRGDYSILIHDEIGKFIYKGEFNIRNSAESISFNIPENIASGSYLLSVILPDKTKKYQHITIR